MTAPIRCEAAGCDALPRYVVGGGAAATFYYCETHAKGLCACEAWHFSQGCTDDPGTMLGDGGTHTRERCEVPGVAGLIWGGSPEPFIVTRSPGTPGGSLCHVEVGE
jgi:hypothetical protein